jgi:hypothetical protein
MFIQKGKSVSVDATAIKSGRCKQTGVGFPNVYEYNYLLQMLRDQPVAMPLPVFIKTHDRYRRRPPLH